MRIYTRKISKNKRGEREKKGGERKSGIGQSTINYIKKNPICNESMTFQECEIAVVKQIASNLEKEAGREMINSTDIQKIIKTVEQFLKEKQLICYGGTAVNNILPIESQFYDKTTEIPDYDFYSYNAIDHAKELANIYYKNGFTNVEAKSGMHVGTFKVFVNFVPVADITALPIELFNALKTQTINKDGILYCPPNFLRMGMYLELSRPKGDVSRWEKVLTRLHLLNKFYPIKVNTDCNQVDFQRRMKGSDEFNKKIYNIVRNSVIDAEVVFFGGYALSIYSEYMDEKMKKPPQFNPDFEVLSDRATEVANKVKSDLELVGIRNVTLFEVDALGEIIPEHIEIRINDETVASVYNPVACHNYNKIIIDNKPVRIATMDTLMSFYLAFLFSNEFEKYQDRILCMANYLFKIMEDNRANNEGVLKRFNMECIGKQHTKTDLLQLKQNKYYELQQHRNQKEFDNWFLKYNPNKFYKSQTKKIRKYNTVKPESKKYDNSNGYSYDSKPNRTKGIFSFIKWREDDSSSSSSSSSSDEDENDEPYEEEKKELYTPTYNGEGLFDNLFWSTKKKRYGKHSQN